MSLIEELRAAHKERKAKFYPAKIAWYPLSLPPDAGWESMWFSDLISMRPFPSRQPSIDEIKRAVADHLGISLHDLLGQTRIADVARARQIAMYLSRTLTKWSHPVIGRKFDRDHTTVLHAVRKVARLMSSDETMQRDVYQIRAALQ